jgi:hypothetical protein
LSGALAQQRPDFADSLLSNRLEHFSPITLEIAAALHQWAGRLAGIPVQVVSHRMYWNPVVSFFRALKKRFSSRDLSFVDWSPEPGSTPLLTGREFTDEFGKILTEKLPHYRVQIVSELQIKVTLGMAGQVNTWAQEGFLGKLVTRLIQDGFEIFISADHGAAEPQGIGRPNEGVLSEKRGQRCRIYNDVPYRRLASPLFQKAFPGTTQVCPKTPPRCWRPTAKHSRTSAEPSSATAARLLRKFVFPSSTLLRIQRSKLPFNRETL